MICSGVPQPLDGRCWNRPSESWSLRVAEVAQVLQLRLLQAGGDRDHRGPLGQAGLLRRGDDRLDVGGLLVVQVDLRLVALHAVRDQLRRVRLVGLHRHRDRLGVDRAGVGVGGDRTGEHTTGERQTSDTENALTQDRVHGGSSFGGRRTPTDGGRRIVCASTVRRSTSKGGKSSTGGPAGRGDRLFAAPGPCVTTGGPPSFRAGARPPAHPAGPVGQAVVLGRTVNVTTRPPPRFRPQECRRSPPDNPPKRTPRPPGRPTARCHSPTRDTPHTPDTPTSATPESDHPPRSIASVGTRSRSPPRTGGPEPTWAAPRARLRGVARRDRRRNQA